MNASHLFLQNNLKDTTMKKIITTTAFAFLLVASISSCKEQKEAEGAKEVAQAEAIASEYTVNTEKSTINWIGAKPTGTHTGTITLSEGSISVVDKNVQAGSFTIDMNSIDATDVEGKMKENLEAHLKGTVEGKEGDFFNVNKYPTGAFKITKVEGENGKVMVSGNLTLLDKTNNVTFPATVSFPENTMFLKSESFKIDRTQWGINYGSKNIFDNLGDKFINDEIELTVELHAAM
ncbi:YCE I like family protein [unidentified eubacterium SCB49]|nr:YCE I like family protein [unidentified eubacterium SCB49]